MVADNTWSAMQGRRVLDVQWDEGPVAAMSTPALTKIFQERMQQPGAEARKEGDAPAALAAAARKIEADYEVPFLAHAPMEPLNCTADVNGDRCTVWASTQGQSAARAIAARDHRPAAGKGRGPHALHGRRLRAARCRGLHRRGRGSLQGGRARP